MGTLHTRCNTAMFQNWCSTHSPTRATSAQTDHKLPKPLTQTHLLLLLPPPPLLLLLLLLVLPLLLCQGRGRDCFTVSIYTSDVGLDGVQNTT
jgi:hypothetical protein